MLTYRCADTFSIVMASGGTFLEATQPGGEMDLEWDSLSLMQLWSRGSEGSASCFGQSWFKPPGLILRSVGDVSQLQSSFKHDCIKSKLWISAEEAGKWSILLILGDRSAVANCKKVTVSRSIAHHSYCICSPEFLYETLFCFKISLNLARLIFLK